MVAINSSLRSLPVCGMRTCTARKVLVTTMVTALSLVSTAAAERVKLPDEVLGLWCLAPESNDEYEFYQRGDCGTGKTTTWILLGPRAIARA
jgi:hypothetical protein